MEFLSSQYTFISRAAAADALRLDSVESSF